jgi:hypothetical protein
MANSLFVKPADWNITQPGQEKIEISDILSIGDIAIKGKI